MIFPISSETSIETISTEPFPLPLKKPYEYKPAQPKAGPSGYKTSPLKTKTPTGERPAPRATSHQNPWPEDDILYQWRLARKMEKAQEKVSGLGVRVPAKKTDPYGIRKPVDVSHTCRAPSQPLSIPVPGLSTYDDVLPGPSGISTLPDLPTPQVSSRVLTSTAVQTPSVTTATTTASSNIRGSHAPVSMVTSYTQPIVTPVLSQPCRHLESEIDGGASFHGNKLRPHMHLACDILPCQCTGDAKMYHHHHHQHQKQYTCEKHKTDDGIATQGSASDGNDHVKHKTDDDDDEKENELPPCKESHFQPDLSKKTSESKKEISQKNKIKTSSSFESLSSSTETENERETRRPRRKGKVKQADNKVKGKENRTSEMVQNVIGQVGIT